MPHGRTNIVLAGLQADVVTEAPSYDLTVPFLGDGLKTPLDQAIAEIMESGGHPFVTEQIPLGVIGPVSLEASVNVGTIRDLLMLAEPVSGVLPAISFAQDRMGVSSAQTKHIGCVCSGQTWEYSRSETPGESNVLKATCNFEAAQHAATTGVEAGTAPTGRRFLIEKGSFTINSAVALAVESFRKEIQIELKTGPLDGSGKRLYIELVSMKYMYTVVARFAAAAWQNLVLNATEHTAVFVHATGTANETVTETIARARTKKHELQGGDIVTEQIEISPDHNGTNAPVVITHGSAIGATVLAA